MQEINPESSSNLGIGAASAVDAEGRGAVGAVVVQGTVALRVQRDSARLRRQPLRKFLSVRQAVLSGDAQLPRHRILLRVGKVQQVNIVDLSRCPLTNHKQQQQGPHLLASHSVQCLPREFWFATEFDDGQSSTFNGRPRPSVHPSARPSSAGGRGQQSAPAIRPPIVPFR